MKAYLSSITKANTEVIVNASNGLGIMGAGVAGAISRAGGPSIGEDARKICQDNGNYNSGDCFISTSGDLSKNGIKNVYHAVTMKFPGQKSSLEIVKNALFNTLSKAIENKVKSIAIPGLGTGIGGLSIEDVANTMVLVAKDFDKDIDIHFIDIDFEFIYFLEKAIEKCQTY